MWLGIPYAEPPIGERRWRAPLPHCGWTGDRDATRAAPVACQPPSFGFNSDERYIGSEDCLYLNIWAPKAATGQSALPVIFWIHGGSNMRGQAHSYDGRILASEQNVVVVSVGYRLGLMGWFRHAALREDADTESASGNFGTLDLIAALRWVRDNIKAFGGDPGKVAIAGNSAGGWNVYSLLVSPLASGLFHRAIIQSGMTMTTTPAVAEHSIDAREPGCPRSSSEILLQLLIDDGLADDRVGAKAELACWDAGRTAQYLRSRSFGQLMRATEDAEARLLKNPPIAVLPIMFADGHVLPADGIAAALDHGEFAPVPMLVGATRDEYSILLFIFGRTMPFIKVDAAGKFEVTDRERFALATEYLSLMMQVAGVYRPAAAVVRHMPGAAYCYRFDWAELEPAAWLGGASLGATHGLEVYFVFGHLDLGSEFFHHNLIPAQALGGFRALSEAIRSYWTSFVYAGLPGQGRDGDLPCWPAYDDRDPKAMLLDSAPEHGIAAGTAPTTRDDILSRLATDPRFVDDAARHDFIDELIAGTDLGVGFTSGIGFTVADHERLDALSALSPRRLTQ